MEENKTCKDCVFYSSALFVCFHPENEGIRAFENSIACGKHRTELKLDERINFFNKLINDYNAL